MVDNSMKHHSPTVRDEICVEIEELQELCGQLWSNVQFYTSKFMILDVKGSVKRAVTDMKRLNKKIEDSAWNS